MYNNKNTNNPNDKQQQQYQYQYYFRPDNVWKYQGSQALNNPYGQPSLINYGQPINYMKKGQRNYSRFENNKPSGYFHMFQTPRTHESQYPFYPSQMKNSAYTKNKYSYFASLRPYTKRILIGLAILIAIIVVAVALGLIPVYLSSGGSKSTTGTFRIRVDNGLKVANPQIKAILDKKVAERTAEETKTLRDFSEKLESQLNDKLKPKFGSDIRSINRVTLIPKNDGDILVNFDVSTIDIGDTKAADIKSNIQSAMNKNDILDGFSSSDPKLSVSTFVVNDPQREADVAPVPSVVQMDTSFKLDKSTENPSLSTLSTEASKSTLSTVSTSTTTTTVSTSEETTSSSTTTTTTTTTTSTTTTTTTTTTSANPAPQNRPNPNIPPNARPPFPPPPPNGRPPFLPPNARPPFPPPNVRPPLPPPQSNPNFNPNIGPNRPQQPQNGIPPNNNRNPNVPPPLPNNNAPNVPPPQVGPNNAPNVPQPQAGPNNAPPVNGPPGPLNDGLQRVQV